MLYSAFGSLILVDERLSAQASAETGGARSVQFVGSRLRKWRVDPDVVMTSAQGMHSLRLCALLGELRRLPSEIVGDSALDGSVSQAQPRSESALFEMTIVPLLMQRRTVLIFAGLGKLEGIRAQLHLCGIRSSRRVRAESLFDLYRFDRTFGAVPVPLHVDWLGSPTRRQGFL